MHVLRNCRAAGLSAALLLLGCDQQPSAAAPSITARALSLFQAPAPLPPDAATPEEPTPQPDAAVPAPPAPQLDAAVPPPPEPQPDAAVPTPPAPQPDAGVPQMPTDEPWSPSDAGVPPPPPIDGNGPRDQTPEERDRELKKYAEECEVATGLKINEFSCLGKIDPVTGAIIQGEEAASPPGQEMNDEGKCRTPNVLNSRCDPGAKFQVLDKNSTDTAFAVAHCRKLSATEGHFRDIAVIAYNRDNGATCFFQAKIGNVDATKIKSPKDGAGRWYENDEVSRWLSPTEMNKEEPCVGCHDTGGFIRSPYLAQLTGKNHLPSTRVKGERFNNLKAQPRYVGDAFKTVRTWTIDLAEPMCIDDGDPEDMLPIEQTSMCKVKRECRTCTSCHSLGVSNEGLRYDYADFGTAGELGTKATAEVQEGKLAHSCESPIWMKPDAVFYSKKADDAAWRYSDCARAWVTALKKQGPGVETDPPQIEGCVIERNGAPWGEPRD